MLPSPVSRLPTYPNLNSRPLFSSPSHILRIPTPIKAKSLKTRPILLCSDGNPRETHHRIRLQNANTPTKTITDPKTLVLEKMFSFLMDNSNKGQRNHGQESSSEEELQKKITSHRGISSNMWWHRVRASLSQRFNFEGTVSAAAVVVRDRHLAVPHLTVPDIRWVDWVELKSRGFQGVVFDKDNTLTCPYSLAVWPPLVESLEQCKSVFGRNVVIFSNSAGLDQYDVGGSKARDIEKTIGIHVIRHGVKKPAGTAEDIEKYFGCPSSLLVMVGDRHFTDIVYGNRNGLLTILTEPFSLAQEPFIVKQVRKLETSLVNHWYKKGWRPTNHSLLSEAEQCVKAPPL